MPDLRSKAIHIAASLPKGDRVRRVLLAKLRGEEVLRSTLLPDDVLDGTKLFLTYESDVGQYVVRTRWQDFYRSRKGLEPNSSPARRALQEAERKFESIVRGKLASAGKAAVVGKNLLARFLQSAILIDTKKAFQKRLQQWAPGSTVAFEFVPRGLYVRIWFKDEDEAEARETAESILGKRVDLEQHRLTGGWIASEVLTWADIQ